MLSVPFPWTSLYHISDGGITWAVTWRVTWAVTWSKRMAGEREGGRGMEGGIREGGDTLMYVSGEHSGGEGWFETPLFSSSPSSFLLHCLPHPFPPFPAFPQLSLASPLVATLHSHCTNLSRPPALPVSGWNCLAGPSVLRPTDEIPTKATSNSLRFVGLLPQQCSSNPSCTSYHQMGPELCSRDMRWHNCKTLSRI